MEISVIQAKPSQLKQKPTEQIPMNDLRIGLDTPAAKAVLMPGL